MLGETKNSDEYTVWKLRLRETNTLYKVKQIVLESYYSPANLHISREEKTIPVREIHLNTT